MKELKFVTKRCIYMQDLCEYLKQKYNENYDNLFDDCVYFHYAVEEYFNDPDEYDEKYIKFAERMKELIGEETIIILNDRS